MVWTRQSGTSLSGRLVRDRRQSFLFLLDSWPLFFSSAHDILLGWEGKTGFWIIASSLAVYLIVAGGKVGAFLRLVIAVYRYLVSCLALQQWFCIGYIASIKHSTRIDTPLLKALPVSCRVCRSQYMHAYEESNLNWQKVHVQHFYRVDRTLTV